MSEICSNRKIEKFRKNYIKSRPLEMQMHVIFYKIYN